MMRLLFTPIATVQHLYPMVPLAWACRAAGHEVRVAAAPLLAAAIVAAGLPAVVIGTDLPPAGATVTGLTARYYAHERFPADWPLRPHLLDAEQRALIEQLGRNNAVAAEAVIDELIGFARAWRPDVIVHDTAGFAGAVTAATLDLPNVRHLTGVGLRPMERRVPGPEPLPEYAGLFERRGLDVRVTPTVTIDPSPPRLRIPPDGRWLEMRYVPYNGAAAAPGWLADPAPLPRVCVTWGLSVQRAALALGRSAFDACRATLDALAALPVEVVLVTMAEQLAQLGELPANVRPAVSAPLYQVLAHCVAVVHQAGDGTAMTAAAMGVPQVCVTQKPDPALTAERLVAAGAAVHLRYRDVHRDPAGGDLIRAAVARVLAEPAYPDAARRLRAEMVDQPAPAALVPALAALTETAHHGR
jgi:glycosyltransferase